VSKLPDNSGSTTALGTRERLESETIDLAAELPPRDRTNLWIRLRLVLLSFLMLFLELALIRWTAANNVHLAYITNLVLIATFLGVGVGFLLADSKLNLGSAVPVFLVLLVGFVLAFPVKLVALRGPHQLQGAQGMAALPRWVSLPVIFVLSVAVMAGVGQAVARTFRLFKPLDAYRLDIIGSIGGIVVFSLISFLWLPPLAWGLVAVAGLLVLLGRKVRWWHAVAMAAMIVLLVLESMSSVDTWSPYYKITAVQPAGHHGPLVVSANNIPHQTAYTVGTLHRIESFYFFPYRHLSKPPNNALIIGAGTGNDVAVALSEGAHHVDAVEVDPVIAQLGRDKSPNNAYASPRVSLFVDDGRAFLQDTNRRYDLILFALPDSLTVLAGQSNLRLENYLLTIQSLQEVKAHLTPHGTFAMYNYYQPNLLNRYASSVTSVYGSTPCVELGNPLAGRSQAVLTIGAGGRVANCATRWHGTSVSPATDDHPFPYLFGSGIPSLYLWTIALILGFSVILIRVVGGPFRPMARYVDLACMGAAFTLLETKNLVQFALLFGTTWFVNSLVFAGILLSVYLAVEVARHVRLPKPTTLYLALLAALIVAWSVPQDDLLSLSVVPRFVAATVIAFAPVFLANLVFAQRFKDVSLPTVAFGANLLGAVVGGLLEYLSLATGYRFLLVLVAILYGLAFVTGRSRMKQLDAGAPASPVTSSASA
jgi:hypothetical protein